jgi:transcription elongation factor Elf1
MGKSKIFKCALCGKKKPVSEINKMYGNEVCNRCFNRLNTNIRPAKKYIQQPNWISNIINKMKNKNE